MNIKLKNAKNNIFKIFGKLCNGSKVGYLALIDKHGQLFELGKFGECDKTLYERNLLILLNWLSCLVGNSKLTYCHF